MKKAFLWFVKGLSALCFAYVLALTVQETISFSLFSFVFLMLSFALAFFFFVKSYKLLGVLVIDALLIVIILLLQFYTIMAYGS